MALKSQRDIARTEIGFFCNDVAERGLILVYGPGGGSGTGFPGGSGISLDDTSAVVSIAATASGQKPAGLLLNNMVDLDLTRTHINFMRDEMIKGGKCTLLRHGWVVTNKVSGNVRAGDKAYLTANGQVTATNSGAAATPPVGEFMSAKDVDGYAKLQVHLPY